MALTVIPAAFLSQVAQDLTLFSAGWFHIKVLTFCFLLWSLDLAVQSWGDALSTSGSAHVQGEIQNKKLKLLTVRKGKSQINQVRRFEALGVSRAFQQSNKKQYLHFKCDRRLKMSFNVIPRRQRMHNKCREQALRFQKLAYFSPKPL